MGMFDRDENFEEHFKVGDTLTLEALEYEGMISTKFGLAAKSVATIGGKRYSLLGVGFAGMAKRATPDEFPVEVQYVKEPTGSGGNEVKLFAPVPAPF